MLRQRIITGSLLAVAAIAAIIWLPAHVLIAVLAALTLLGCWEWSDLAALTKPLVRLLYCLLSACAMFGLLGVTHILDEYPDLARLRWILGAAALWWCLAWLCIKTFPQSTVWWGGIWVRLLMGWLALLPAWLACVYLRLQSNGEWKVLFLLTLVAAADIGAYFSGTQFGKHKLAPAVSPGKSWEGFWGGLVTSVVFALSLWRVLWEPQLPLLVLAIIAALTMLASVLGDLLESMLKRYRGVKDSGSILPGHGGVLDRFDSISAAAPVFALGLLLTAL
ncbi:MAG TPA: phosphatidate cytidylyltransferase [Spongiibacteraceae bacterium]|nr:phosphatidate cytidylyltransferase [Spongiibacteraceae bacterium]